MSPDDTCLVSVSPLGSLPKQPCFGGSSSGTQQGCGPEARGFYCFRTLVSLVAPEHRKGGTEGRGQSPVHRRLLGDRCDRPALSFPREETEERKSDDELQSAEREVACFLRSSLAG